MISKSPLISRFARSLLLLMGTMLLGGTLYAVPPAAPSNVRAFVSKRTVETSRSTFWHVTWQDNALDEAGYLVRGRVLYQGAPVTPYFDWANEPANSTSAIIILGDIDSVYTVQFQVIAYKQNGNQFETRVGTNQAEARPPAISTWAAPTGLTLETVDDGTIKAKWNDNSTTEIRFELLVRKTGTSPWLLAADPLLGQNELNMRLGLEPNTAYEWAIRAVRFSVFGALSDRLPVEAGLVVVPFTTAPLTPPTNFVATLVDDSIVKFRWSDNSTAAMGYAIQYRNADEVAFTTLAYTGGNDTSYETAVGPGTEIEWRVAAAYQPEGGAVVTSAPSNSQFTSIPGDPHSAPTGFSAVATALAGSVAVRWSGLDPDVTQVRVVARLAESGDDFSTLTTVAAGRHHVLLTDLPIGVEREFGVIALGPRGLSEQSNTVTATPTQGFDPAWYKANLDPVEFGVIALTPLLTVSVPNPVSDPDPDPENPDPENPDPENPDPENPDPENPDPENPAPDPTIIVANEAVKGQPFSHTLKITDEGSREAWDVTGLPPGMNPFDVESDSVSGIPSEAGLFDAMVSLTYEDQAPLIAKMVFRVREQTGAPIVTQPLPATTLGLGAFDISLDDYFTDPDAPKAARVATTLGDIEIALYDNVTPQHVDNFLAYVTAGDYDGVAFHRSLPGFVIQAGGFKPVTSPDRFATVAKRPSPFNEPGLANVRGTIAAAKLGGDPDSATTDIFFNLNDNRENLDNQNSGFTVFGRVTGTGMNVVDMIAAKPRNDYTVFIDGLPAPFNDWPMNAQAAPESMDIAQTVKIESATEISPLIYSVANSDPSVVEVTINERQLNISGLSDGVAEITITATDLDGQGVSQTFEITIDGNVINPLILTSPSSQILPAGSTATFTVVAQGTDLSYVWRKNGVPIPDEEGSSLQLTDIDDADAAAYDVVVGNNVKSVTSASATLAIAKPALITSQPQSVIVRSGTPLTLATGVTGTPTPTVTWTRDGTVVAGATEPTLAIASAALADAGIYQSSVVGDGEAIESNPVAAVVVDATTRTVAVKQGGNATATVVVAKPEAIDVGYLWRRNGVPLIQNNKFLGVTTARLTMRGMGLLDAGIYTCDVTAPGAMGTVISGNFNVVVATKPQLVDIAVPFAFVGRDYEFVIPAPEVSSQTPTRYTVAGLPRGLKLEAATGRLHGRPTRAGVSNLRIRAFNPAGGGNTVTASLRVVPLPAPTVGAFTGLLARQSVLTSNGGGVMKVAVTDNGAFSGNVVVPGKRYLVRGKVNRLDSGAVTGATTITRRGAEPLFFDFTINPNTGYSTGNLRLNQTTNAEIIGWKNVWHARFNSTREAGYMAANVTTGYYTLAMTPPAGGPEIPKGTGFASVTVATSGRTTVRGRTVDGQSVLFNGPLSPNGEFFVYQPLDRNTGSLLGPLRILAVDEDGDGTNEVRIQKLEGIGFDQFKDVRPAGERLYQAGFGLLPLTVKGGPYAAPVSPNFRILGLQDLTPFASLRFFDGGLAASATDPDVVFSIRRDNTAMMPIGAAFNPGAVRWKINAKTGLFSGRFTLVDGAFRRNVNYFGLLVPMTPTSVKGVGSFQLLQLPGTGETLKTSPIMTGRVDLQPNPPVD